MSTGGPESFTVATTVRDGVRVVSAKGDIDLDEATELEAALLERDGAVVVDLTAVGYIGTRGLMALVVANDRARERGRRLVVVCEPEGTVATVTRVIGGGSVFTILHELPAAIELAVQPL